MMRQRFAGVLLGAGLQCACSQTPRGPAVVPPVAEAHSAPVLARGLPDRNWQRVTADGHAFELALPDVNHWRLQHTDTWMTWQHAATESRLELKHWSQGQLVDAADCAAQVALWKPALAPADAVAIESIVGPWPAGYLARVQVFSASPAEGRGSGYVAMTAAHLRECFALRFLTRASGERAAEAVAQRLALVVKQVIPSVRLRDVDARIEREGAR